MHMSPLLSRDAATSPRGNVDAGAAEEIADLLPRPTPAPSSPTARTLRSRARQLRRDANVRLAPLADALRRRAAELELQAFVLDNTLVPARVPRR